MGNNLTGSSRNRTKVMKIDGQTLKFETPIRAYDVTKDHPGHVLLESSTAKQFGIRAKPLEPQQDLKPNKLYFLIEMPKLPDDEEDRYRTPRRARSAVNMSAKDRLECLMLSPRSSSDVSVARSEMNLASDRSVRVKMRLPRAQVAKLVEESRDGVEAAQKIIDLYLEHNGGAVAGSSSEGRKVSPEVSDGLWHRDQWKPRLGVVTESVV